MNFVVWLLKRMRRTILGSEPFRFIEGYRDFMEEEFIGTMVITLLLGLAQFILGGVLVAWICDGSPPKYIMYILLANPVIFFVYNWLVILHRKYTSERMEVWEELKR